MKVRLFAAVLVASTLCFAASAKAQPPPPLPAANASFDAGSLHVDVYGTRGAAIVFIPGLTCGPWEWSREIALYAPDYRVYALTLPGFDGRAPISGPLFKTFSTDFWAMLSAHSIRKPVLIGHSLGGTLAIMLAEEHSRRLGGVVAVDGLPILPGEDRMTPAQRAAAAKRIVAMIGGPSTPAQFEAVERSYVLPRLITSPADIAAVAPLIARSDPHATAAWMAEDMTTDLRPNLDAVTVPLLEIAPYDPRIQSTMFPNAKAVRSYYASLLAGDTTAQVETISPSRHFVMLDRPHALDAAITAFLRQLP